MKHKILFPLALVKKHKNRHLSFVALSVFFLISCNGVAQTVQEFSDPNSKAMVIEKPTLAVNKEKDIAPPALEKKLPKSSYKTAVWTDLMPKDDLDALLNPPDYLSEIADGSLEDQISSQVKNTLVTSNNDRYQQALVSTKVIPALDGEPIRIPGFVVPVEFNDDQLVTQFFLVPFFGACLHMPPPPPNQIIFVRYPEGLKLDSLFDPFWISGIIYTSIVEMDIAKASYSLNLHYYEKYEE